MHELVKTEPAEVLPLEVSIWDAFLMELDASERTRDSYRKALRVFTSWLTAQEVEPLQATAYTIKQYKESLRASYKAATVNAYLTAVRSFYTWTESRRVYPNVARGIKGERVNSRSSKEALTKEQAERLLVEPQEPEDVASLRDYAIVNLMTRRGLRTCEVARADVGDIRQVNGKAVLYVQGKGYSSKGEFVVLGEECLKPITDYLTARGSAEDTEPLFTAVSNHNGGGRLSTRSVSRIAKQSMSAAGISSPRLTAHSLRHTAVTFALLGGASVQEVQAMARHADISTTMIYAHNIERAEAKAERAADAYLAG